MGFPILVRWHLFIESGPRTKAAAVMYVGIWIKMSQYDYLHDTKEPGPWFNTKTPSFQYRESHCGDNTVVRSFYPHNWISYTGKNAFLYWINPQMTADIVFKKSMMSFEIFADRCIIFLKMMSYSTLANIDGQYLNWPRMFIIHEAIEIHLLLPSAVGTTNGTMVTR